MSEKKSDDALAYCADLVQRGNYPAFLLALSVPGKSRAPYLVLFALLQELLELPQKVSNDTLRTIRLKWWHDAVMDVLQGKEYQQPVLLALRESVQSGVAWPQEKLTAFFDAVQAQLYGDAGGVERVQQAVISLMRDWPHGEKAAQLYLRICAHLAGRGNTDYLLPLRVWWWKAI